MLCIIHNISSSFTTGQSNHNYCDVYPDLEGLAFTKYHLLGGG